MKGKTEAEIESMREGGKITSETLRNVAKAIKVGTTLIELDTIARDTIAHNNAIPSFLGYRDYPAVLCISVNDGVVHGIPTSYKIREGDVVSIDLGVFYQGFHTDLSQSYIAGNQPENVDYLRKKTFLAVGEQALANALNVARAGNRIGDISHAIEQVITKAGYSIIRELTGHGVGRKLHENPFIPGFGAPHTGDYLLSGQTLAIEVIYAEKNPAIKTLSDGWTIVTRDHSLGGLFERTVVIKENGCEILTLV